MSIFSIYDRICLMNKQFLDTVGKRIRILRQDLDFNQGELVNELAKQGIDVGRSIFLDTEKY